MGALLEPLGMPDAPHVAGTAYRDAMARLPAAVNVITTGKAAARAGFTASAVCSVTDAPPTLLVCLNHSSSVYATFSAADSLCVNVLAASQQPVAMLFGGKTPMAERFAAADWHTLATGAPVLVGASASFDCRIVQRSLVGTHDVLLCEVVALAFDAQPDGLVYFNRRFQRVPAAG